MVADTRLTFEEMRALLIGQLGPAPEDARPADEVARQMWEDGATLGDICTTLRMDLGAVYRAIHGGADGG